MDNRIINLASDDSLAATGQKLLKALDFIEHEGFNYDFIFRTNLSSYIFVDNLLKFIEQNQDENLYSGFIGSYNTLNRYANALIRVAYHFEILNKICSWILRKHSLKFASGSGFWISRKNVQILLNDPKIKTKLMDDVMVGECMSRYGVPIINSNRIDLNDDRITYKNNIWRSYNLIKSCYHIRLKSNDRLIDVDRFFLLNKHGNFPENLYV